MFAYNHVCLLKDCTFFKAREVELQVLARGFYFLNLYTKPEPSSKTVRSVWKQRNAVGCVPFASGFGEGDLPRDVRHGNLFPFYRSSLLLPGGHGGVSYRRPVPALPHPSPHQPVRILDLQGQLARQQSLVLLTQFPL